MTRRSILAVALLAIVMSGCGRVLPADYTLHVSNSTTMPVALVINGQPIDTLPPDAQRDYPPGRLAALPWAVEATTAGGRRLLTLRVEDGSIKDERALDGTGTYSSVGQRLTLTCGQLWVWVGEPGTGGPMAEGVPGDCDP